MEKDRKRNRKTVTVVCANCKKTFEKVKSEVVRNAKKGRNNYCSRECAVKGAVKTRTGVKRGIATDEQKNHLLEICGNRRDEYTPYRYTFRTIKARYKEVDITIDDLIEVWKNQNGKCPYTGYDLILPENGNLKKIDIFHRASLDRIDSSKGYVKGNIQFVSTPINYLKSDKTDEEVRKFLKDISEYTMSL